MLKSTLTNMRIHLIERFGTGIRRIVETYKNSIVKPRFDVAENSIKIILPVQTETYCFSESEKMILDLMREHGNEILSSSRVAEMAKMGKTRVVEILSELTQKVYVVKNGNGRGTSYSVKR